MSTPYSEQMTDAEDRLPLSAWRPELPPGPERRELMLQVGLNPSPDDFTTHELEEIARSAEPRRRTVEPPKRPPV